MCCANEISLSSMLKITIITATLNSEFYLPRLISSLRSQTDLDFEWIVSDGGSTDKTLSLLKSCDDLKLRVMVFDDFGIYDALNKAINTIYEGYYLVLGSDDVISSNAIEMYKKFALVKNIEGADYDIITTAVKQNGRIIMPNENYGWLFGLPGLSGHHAVGTLISVKLHKQFGMYSRKFPIAADQLFIKKCLKGGATILRLTFVAGEFSSEGVSGTDHLGVITEVFRVQVITGENVSIQFVLFLLRCFKLYLKYIFRLTKLN